MLQKYHVPHRLHNRLLCGEGQWRRSDMNGEACACVCASSLVTVSGNSYMQNNTAGENGGGIYINTAEAGETPLLTVLDSTRIEKNTAGLDGGGIWIPYEALNRLDVGADVIFAGNLASRAYQINPIDIPTHIAHILTDTFTTPFIYGYNNYDISYTNGEPFIAPIGVILSGSKSAIGASLACGIFGFGLYDSEGNLISIVTNRSQ